MPFERIARAAAGAPAAAGYLAVETERGPREYLLGPRTQLDAVPPMLDWHTAPLAEAFFRHGAGEPYELPSGAEGRVRERWLLVGRGGLEALIGDARIVTREGERRAPRPAPAPAREVDRRALLRGIEHRQRAVELPADTSLVLDGEAGVGKTLVALYRLAALARRAEAKRRRFRALVLVPTEGLRRLVGVIADRLGVGALEIALVEDWLVERARRAFPGLPKRTSEGAGAQVIALKRHPALRAVLRDFVAWRPPRGVERDDQLPRSRVRLLHLFGDHDRLARVVEAAGGALPERAIAATMQHTRRQFEATTERALRHVDADRLAALDGRSLDAGTPAQDASTFDVEDAAVLFELRRLGALPSPELDRYDHIVVDEAQLRAPLELAAIGDALAPSGTATLAGDDRQATDETAWFTGWAAARAELRRPRWAATTLAITYRSVPAIGGFARAIVERTARVPPEPPPDPAVWATACPGPLAQAALACWHLDALLAREPWRQICVAARTPEHARRLHGELARGLDPELVLDGDFRFEPGVLVTTAAAISGLEFDGVVIPDLTPGFYPEGPELARSLYVAASRARDWLWLLTPEAWSPLVAA